MREMLYGSLLAALLSSGCAGSTSMGRVRESAGPGAAVRAASHRPSLAKITPSITLTEGAEFRRALEEAHDLIVQRSKSGVNLPVADASVLQEIDIPEHPSIHGAVSLFSNALKKSVQTSLLRSAKYRELIEKTLDAERLPHALTYLPVIESAYIPTLTSKAGARGIWQFMPATARDYGMRLDWWVDERTNPVISTRAAALFLKRLHKEFGDWSLALAAYNCGPGRVRRTLRESGATTFWELYDRGLLPKETRGYVPTFWATILIASDPSRYGFQLTDSIPAEGRRGVELEGPLSLAYVAEVSRIDEETLREMNPELQRGIIPPGRREISVPEHTVEILRSRSASLRYEDPGLAVATFTLREGDDLLTLARSIGVEPSTILGMNDLRKDTLRPGDSIYLPVRQREVSRLLASREPSDSYYGVEKGDTLYSIAKRNGLTVDELVELNELTAGAAIHVGDRLLVRTGAGTTAGGM